MSFVTIYLFKNGFEVDYWKFLHKLKIISEAFLEEVASGVWTQVSHLLDRHSAT
jgi:hypothetical protein